MVVGGRCGFGRQVWLWEAGVVVGGRCGCGRQVWLWEAAESCGVSLLAPLVAGAAVEIARGSQCQCTSSTLFSYQLSKMHATGCELWNV